MTTRVFMSATSYPRTAEDWQGVFIKHIASALADSPDIALTLWAPDGPRHDAIEYACDEDDRDWLEELTSRGGIAHLLKQDKTGAIWTGAGLLRRLRRSYQAAAETTDCFHINWLQNALPLLGLETPAVITVLGTDFKLLGLPGMKTTLRRVLRNRQAVLAPNADWMCTELERHFGDLAEVRAVPFGIDDRWYELQTQPAQPSRWIAVLRVTSDKIGPLFEWGESLFAGGQRELHLIGPNQDDLDIPDWVHFHGPASPEALAEQWFPSATGMITLSQHSEGRPQVMLESMAAALPIVASDLPAHRDFIDHGRTGLLVDTRDQLEAALARLEASAEREAIAANCRQFAYDSYGTWRDCANRFRTLYEKIRK